MEQASITNQNATKFNQVEENNVVLVSEEEVEHLKQCLPKANLMGNSKFQLIKIQDFWYFYNLFPNFLSFQRNFVAQNTDIFLTSFPKTGTTWLKSLIFCIINRYDHPPNQSPLLTHNPHELVFDLETGIYGGNLNFISRNQLNHSPPPRLLHSHLPYASLPESIKTCNCKIVYVARNPLDTLVSHWHYFPKIMKKRTGDENFQRQDINDFFEDFCQGNVCMGPFFEHVVGYWKQSLEQPNKVLFLKYEDLKDNPSFYVKQLAQFVGVPFTTIEENEGVLQQIIDLCSLTNLKKLEVNKGGMLSKFVENNFLFREGEVGGWRRYLSASMADKMKSLMEEKLGDTGLTFKLLPEEI